MTTIELKKYINENDKVPFILEKCGCHHIKDHGEYVSAANPDGDNPGAINIYKNDYLNYVNYTRGVSADMKQDIINLVQSTKGMNFIDAFKWLHEANEISFSSGKPPSKKPINTGKMIVDIFKKYRTGTRTCDVRDIKFIDPKELNDFGNNMIHVDLFREGIIKKTIIKFGLKYDWIHHRTCFIHRDWLTGNIVGINARTSIKDYMLLGIKKYYLTPGFNKTRQLYGLWENRETIEKDKYCTLFEAEKSVCKRDSRNDAHGLAISGKMISIEQVRLILGLNINEVILALDNDVDIFEIYNIAEKFYKIKKVSFIKDVNNYLGEKDSPADADNNIYIKLFNERVIYDEKLHKKYIRRENGKS